jgi:hypothetical protein
LLVITVWNKLALAIEILFSLERETVVFSTSEF